MHKFQSLEALRAAAATLVVLFHTQKIVVCPASAPLRQI
jgi:peptidoglycan/LPS O-acetylase OafA/YrhL